MSEVRDDRAARRFVLEADGATAIAAYRREGDRIVFTHTEVPDALAGRGIGTRLVEGALDAVRIEGMTVVPACGFVRAFINRRPEYRDLL